MSKTPRSSIASTVASQTLSKGVSRKLSRELAAYLLSEGRTSELDPLMRDVQALWTDQGYVNATAISAHPINAEARKKIRQTVARVYPTAKTITISEEQDPAIIAGVRIELSDRQLDVSVATKLNKFKRLTTGKD
jgi:F-type H+-transporting ATPase subunit O